jgi:hypothetical protein
MPITTQLSYETSLTQRFYDSQGRSVVTLTELHSFTGLTVIMTLTVSHVLLKQVIPILDVLYWSQDCRTARRKDAE